MSIYEKISKWRDDRVALAHAEERRRALWLEYNVKKGEQERGPSSRADRALTLHVLLSEVELLDAEVGEIETRRVVSRAVRWQVPVPTPPFNTQESTSDWEWHRVHDAHYLSEEGKARHRRETYLEMDMRYRPIATWAAVGISIISLIVSVLKP